MGEPRPPDDSPKTWHVHDDEGWGWGISCDECYTRPDWIGKETVHLAISELKKQNKDGMTTREMEREILGDRWDDPKVQRAR
jgi:hypothetical protein